MKIKILVATLLTVIVLQIKAQENLIYVSGDGLMRWVSDDTPAYFWGVNYSVPFAFSYRAIKEKSFSHKEVIDHDIQQFKRLNLNAYRIHVWDREISDKEGNLIENEHLKLLDYLIAKLIENNIYIILTPIAWWGAGYPEPDPPTNGFSDHGSKIDLTTKEELIKAQENYLDQFVNHKNKFTGKSYKEEPKIIAFEIINEPKLPDDSTAVTDYVNRTVIAVRNAGVTKPILFNISENPGLNQWTGVANSNIDGVSFQWYPTGLVKGSMLKGNYLPHVSQYPYREYADKIMNKAKMVYEFDAADVAQSVLYPVMANSFREAGMQWATMFSYDPTPIAKYNAEYITHYLNLAFTPGKAVSYLIAGDLFRNKNLLGITTGFNKIKYSPYKVDYKNDLSLLNSDEKFYYSNSTDVYPSNPALVKHVAGVGTSKLVSYSGTGAYFLDRIDQDTWKLEVFPDAVWIDDPFGNNNLQNPVAELIWLLNKMRIHLPGLTSNYNVYSYGREFKKITIAENYEINIMPGSYLISNSELKKEDFKNLSFFDFENLRKFTYTGDFLSIKNNTPLNIKESDPLVINCNLYTYKTPQNVLLYYRKFGWRNFAEIEFEQVTKYNYQVKIPEQFVSNGIIEYYVTVDTGGVSKTFPGNSNISPEHWGFDGDEGYIVNVKPVSKDVVLFDPAIDTENIVFPNTWYQLRFRSELLFKDDNSLFYNVALSDYNVELPEYTLQVYVGEQIKEDIIIEEFKLDLDFTSVLIDTVELRFIYDNGKGFIQKFSRESLEESISVKPSALSNIRFALLPRPYPVFLPYWFNLNGEIETGFNHAKLEFIQIALPLIGIENGKKLNTSLGIKKISAIRK